MYTLLKATFGFLINLDTVSNKLLENLLETQKSFIQKR